MIFMNLFNYKYHAKIGRKIKIHQFVNFGVCVKFNILDSGWWKESIQILLAGVLANDTTARAAVQKEKIRKILKFVMTM